MLRPKLAGSRFVILDVLPSGNSSWANRNPAGVKRVMCYCAVDGVLWISSFSSARRSAFRFAVTSIQCAFRASRHFVTNGPVLTLPPCSNHSVVCPVIGGRRLYTFQTIAVFIISSNRSMVVVAEQRIELGRSIMPYTLAARHISDGSPTGETKEASLGPRDLPRRGKTSPEVSSPVVYT